MISQFEEMGGRRSSYIVKFFQLIILISSFGRQFSLSTNELYPFGPSVDERLAIDSADGSSAEIPLSVPIVYYENRYSSIFVNDNGLVSFLTEVPTFHNAPLPLQYPIIAIMYSNVDIRATGNIYYRETKEPSLLDRATRDINRHFSDGQNFQAQSLFIATWDKVGRFDRLSDQVNTAQLVIVSDGISSYAFILYPENGIQWLVGKDNIEHSQHAITQAGFMSNEGQYYILPGSGTEQVKNFPRMSNINRPGVFAYKIGNLQGANILEPDRDYHNPLNQNELETCSNTKFPCVPSANCVEYSNGICCECMPGFVGNGRSCIPENSIMRINGKMTGEVNEQRISDHKRLYYYIETKEGRAYTSLSQMDPDFGSDLQTLVIILGQTPAWLFAVKDHNTPNGFTLTGGVFNRTVDIIFQQTGNRATIREQYMGLDIFNVLGLKVDVEGSFPTIPLGSPIQINDYKYEINKIAPGVLKSQMTLSYTYDNSIDFPITVDQTITFNECPNKPFVNEPQVSKLNIVRNHIEYDPSNEVVRYAFFESRISELSEQNPCENVQCSPHSTCIVEGDNHRCVCNEGFHYSYAENRLMPICVDVDECQGRGRVCDENAYCLNEIGSFRCQCMDGYTGDGFVCFRNNGNNGNHGNHGNHRNNENHGNNGCNNVHCAPNAECVYAENRGPQCVCKAGFYGDESNCQPLENDASDCRTLNICDLNAECKLNQISGRHTCICKNGYRGDGIVCTEESESCEKLNNCGQNAECVADESSSFNYYCSCNKGFVGDGYTCIAEINSDDCNTLNNCHRDAFCALDIDLQTYQCQCKTGFTGDGYRCINSSFISPCIGLDGCSPNADCVFDSKMGTNICKCRPGFVGNGMTCNPGNVCHPNENNCDPNAQCLQNDVTMKYECQCKPGYYGDGLKCLVDESVDCNVVNNCDKNASCVVDSYTLQYYCKCNTGFMGDGKSCKKHISCNQLNTCDVKAECIFDMYEQNYRCHCISGFVGDGQTCRPLRSCREDRYICHQNAECIFNDYTRDFMCKCHYGFIGDGYDCEPMPILEGDYILFAQGMSVLRMPLKSDGQDNGYPLFIKSEQNIVSIDIDCLTGFIYWGDLAKGNIYKATNNGSSAEIIFEGFTTAPEGIAIDWVSRNIYWTDSFKRTIEVANLEGTLQKVLIENELHKPRGIAVHPGNGKLYWSDWNREMPKIEYSDLDGKHRNILVQSDLKLPNNLAIDYDRNELCWTDAGLHRIECIHLMNLNRRVVYSQASYPFDLAISSHNIYWTDWETKLIHKINRNGGEPKNLTIPLGGNGRLYGLVAVPKHCPRISNACAINNGGCKHLCLPNDNGRSCVCPDNAYHEDDICNEI